MIYECAWRRSKASSKSARSQKLGQAAGELFITQPALTARIQRLEQELGVPLFVRTPTGMRLTDPGRTFLPWAVRALDAVEEGRRHVEELARGGAGRACDRGSAGCQHLRPPRAPEELLGRPAEREPRRSHRPLGGNPRHGLARRGRGRPRTCASPSADPKRAVLRGDARPGHRPFASVRRAHAHLDRRDRRRRSSSSSTAPRATTGSRARSSARRE